MHVVNAGEHMVFAVEQREDVTPISSSTGGCSEGKLRGASNALPGPCPPLFHPHLLPLASLLLYNSESFWT